MTNFVKKMQTAKCLTDIDFIMKKNFLTFAFFFIFYTALFVSCATTVKYNVSRPAKLNSYEITSVALIPYSPEISLSTASSPQAVACMEKLSNQLSQEFLEDGSVSLIDYSLLDEKPDSEKASCDAYINFSVSKFFVYDNFYLADGSSVSSSDYSKKSFYNVDEYGRPLPLPQYVFENSDSSSVVTFSSDTTVSRHVDMEFSYAVVQSSTKKIIQMENFVISADSEEYDFGKTLPAAVEIVEKNLLVIAKKIISNFKPYTILKSHELVEDPKNEVMKNAVKIAAKNDVQNLSVAKNLFYEEYSKNRNFNAAYNYSVISLALGNVNDAFEVMTEVCENSDNALYESLLLEISEEKSFLE